MQVNSKLCSGFFHCHSIARHIPFMVAASMLLSGGALAPTESPAAEDCVIEEGRVTIEGWQDWQKLNSTPIVSPGHSNVWVDIYVNEFAEEAYRTISASFPVCAKVVKVSYKDEEGKLFVDLTAMVKMPRGYDAENGDWWYALYYDIGVQPEKQGVLISDCISCHQQASGTDYLFSKKVMNAIKE